MKKITFLFTLFTCALNAQTFPAPYCTITDADDVTVEEITTVNFGSSTITNTNDLDVLLDFTTTQVSVAPGQPYIISVSGNTYGNFDTIIVAFIDWNNNGILDDEGEIYEIGTLTNSDGADETFVTTTITVPTTATIGTKRIRITKIYSDEDSVAITNPCAISFDVFGFSVEAGFGQALDFTLDVGTLSNTAFDKEALSIYPVPARNNLTIAYKSAIGNMQVYNQLGQEVYTSSNVGNQVDLDVSNFATGVYFIKLYNETESQTVRIIKE